jgi:acyl-CoA synthetase (AMP-forming)/AMP-acid ligase II
VSFWALAHGPDQAAIVDAATGASLTYPELSSRVSAIEAALATFGRRSLGLVLAENTVDSVAVYLAALRSGAPAMLSDAGLNPELFTRLVAAYRPDWIFSSQGSIAVNGYEPMESPGPHLLRRLVARDRELHPELALLLSTSGSTGSPKLVRLARRNLEANAESIAEYLALSPAERPITSLPMSYSYGLSVINSHLLAGATLVLTGRGVLQKEFWAAFREHRCTSLAGVPYTYQMLLKLRLLEKELPSLRTLTQAGGRLDPMYIEQVHRIAAERGWRFYVMYGQTEASARIAYVPPDDLHRKVGSIGIAIPGGSLRVDEDGELVYSGPNVMLGYAECEADLARGDESRGVLRTGDLGREDEEGFFFITGRRKRFLKLFGQRFNLDEAERVLAAHLEAPVACLGSDDQLSIVVAGTPEHASAARGLVSELFGIHHSAVTARAVDSLPVNANGKTDYEAAARVVSTTP